MQTDLIKQWFPNGVVPQGDMLNFDDFMNKSEFDTMTFLRNKIARRMITHIYKYYYNKDGTTKSKVLYDVFPNNLPDKYSCLNAFGSRMLIEFLTDHELTEIDLINDEDDDSSLNSDDESDIIQDNDNMI